MFMMENPSKNGISWKILSKIWMMYWGYPYDLGNLQLSPFFSGNSWGFALIFWRFLLPATSQRQVELDGYSFNLQMPSMWPACIFPIFFVSFLKASKDH